MSPMGPTNPMSPMTPMTRVSWENFLVTVSTGGVQP